MRPVMRFFPAIAALFVIGGIVVVMHTITTEKLRSAYTQMRNYEREIDVLKATNRDLELLTSNVLQTGAAKLVDTKSASVKRRADISSEPEDREPMVATSTDVVAAASSPMLRNPAPVWRKFGMSSHEKQCESVFGMDLVDIWRGKPEQHCASDSKDGSSLTCYRHHQLRHSGPDIMCVGQNMQFDFAKPRPANKVSAFGEDGHFTLPGGTLRAVCAKTPAFALDKFPMSQKVRCAVFVAFRLISMPCVGIGPNGQH